MTAFALGMPTLIELPSLEANVRLCRELGLSFVELNMNSPLYNPRDLPGERLLRLQQDMGIEFTLHLPEEIDLASFHPSIRQGHLDCCANALRWAGQAGIRIVCLHLNSGVYFTLPDRKVWLYEQYRPDFLRTMKGSFEELLPLAESEGVRICLENAGNFSLGFIAEAVGQLLEMSCTHIGLTWDAGHDAGSGSSDRTVLQEHKHRLAHMHLHDSNGSSSHQILFSGIVDVPGMLALARQADVAVVVETKTVEALRESIAKLNDHGLL